MNRYLTTLLAAFAASATAPGAAPAASDAPAVRSVASGQWSDPGVWDKGRVPSAGDRVLVCPGHRIVYDVESSEVIRLLQVAGTLEFTRDRDTRLEVGLVKVIADEHLAEEGFDCHFTPHSHAEHADHAQHGASHGQAEEAPRPALIVGAEASPIPAAHRAVIRLHYIEGMDRESCPAIVCCGGRMDLHGAPMRRTWAKLGRNASAGEAVVWSADPIDGWRVGDRVLVTRTRRRMPMLTALKPDAPHEPEENEVRTITSLPEPTRHAATNGFAVHLDAPLRFPHDAHGDYRGEIANLSRNVVVESADPEGHRGHTMYHVDSSGSIGYAEFRHLGKRGVLGRYPVHFHLVADTMRGSFVRGASIWDSHNRWIAIHGTNYLVVRDCVGFDCVGHGYFLEDGTETMNVLDENLAVLAREGEPLPEQAVPYDQNLGAGFWWANSYNAITGNVAVDCDDYGYRFDAKRHEKFDPVLPIMRPDGRVEPADIRSLPFLAFRGNEAHTQRSGGLNLRGPSRPTSMIYEKLNRELVRESRESVPDRHHPFWVHNYRAWDCSWAFHTGAAGVFLQGFDAYANDYAVWRSVMDRQVWKDTSIHGTLNKDLHMPYSIGVPDGDDRTQLEYLAAVQGFVDDFPPVTVVTRVLRHADQLVVRGTAADSTEVARVVVNGTPAAPREAGYAEWEAVLPLREHGAVVVEAAAEDIYGNADPRPHRIEFDPRDL